MSFANAHVNAIRPQCENCDVLNNGVTLRYRLNPINFIPNEKKLCSPCGKLLGFVAVDWNRTLNVLDRVRPKGRVAGVEQ